jgi:hypothetical protein
MACVNYQILNSPQEYQELTDAVANITTLYFSKLPEKAMEVSYPLHPPSPGLCDGLTPDEASGSA